MATNAELAGRRRSFCSFAPLRGGALVLILVLGLAFVSAFVEVLREWRSLDASAKGPWSRAIWAGTPVVWPVTVPRVRFTTSRNGSAEICVAYHYYRSTDIIIMLGLTPVADDIMSVSVRPKPLMYR